MIVRRLKDLETLIKGREKKTLAVARGQDPHTIEAVARAVQEGFVDAIMVGEREKIEALAKEKGIDPSIFEIVEEKDEAACGKKAVQLVHDGKAHIVMKGLISTIYYMKAILDKQDGLLPPGKILSHVTLIDAPRYHKILIVSDVAVIPTPTLEQKIAMLKYCINVAHKLGIEKPKAAIIAANEKVSDKVPATVDAAIISTMARRGQIKGAIVDGPVALDIAISKESAEIKGVDSPVAGDADILIFHDIETGNVFFKSVTYLGGGSIAAMVAGAKAPAILTSRSDTEDSKFYSILMAAAMA